MYGELEGFIPADDVAVLDWFGFSSADGWVGGLIVNSVTDVDLSRSLGDGIEMMDFQGYLEGS